MLVWFGRFAFTGVMMRILTFILLVTCGCATTIVPAAHVFKPDQEVESRPLPPDARKEVLVAVGSETDVAPITKDEKSPWDGIVESEARAARDAQIRIRYDELWKRFEADRTEWTAQRSLYEERILYYRKEADDLQPDWWEKHASDIALILGFASGVAATVAVVKAAGSTK